NERRVLHHGERRDVAVLHVALRWIGDLHQVFEGMDALPFAFDGGTGHRLRGIAAFGPDGHAAVAHVIDVAVDGSDHDVLRHVLETGERTLDLREVVRCGHAPG